MNIKLEHVGHLPYDHKEDKNSQHWLIWTLDLFLKAGYPVKSSTWKFSITACLASPLLDWIMLEYPDFIEYFPELVWYQILLFSWLKMLRGIRIIFWIPYGNKSSFNRSTFQPLPSPLINLNTKKSSSPLMSGIDNFKLSLPPTQGSPRTFTWDPSPILHLIPLTNKA